MRAISKRDERICIRYQSRTSSGKTVKIDEPGRRSDCKKKYSPFLPSALFPPVECRIQCPYSVPFIAMTRDPERFVAIKLILRAKRRWEHGKGTETDGEKEKGAGSKGWKRERG